MDIVNQLSLIHKPHNNTRNNGLLPTSIFPTPRSIQTRKHNNNSIFTKHTNSRLLSKWPKIGTRHNLLSSSPSPRHRPFPVESKYRLTRISKPISKKCRRGYTRNSITARCQKNKSSAQTRSRKKRYKSSAN